MVALKNGIIQNKDGHPFDRSTGTWKNQNVEENSSVVKEDASNPNNQDTTTEKKPDTTTEKKPDTTTQNSDSTETQQSDNEKKPSDAKTKETPAKTPNQNAEIPKTPGETSKTLLEIPEPRTIYYNIDGNQVHISVNDWPRFQELRRQLASGIPLDDDLIRKMKPILAETHLPDGTKIFNDETKLSHQLDDIMKHHRGKEISSLNDVLRLVLHTIR